MGRQHELIPLVLVLLAAARSAAQPVGTMPAPLIERVVEGLARMPFQVQQKNCPARTARAILLRSSR